MCLCVWRASKRTAHRGQKRASVLLELELEAFENRPDVDAGKWTAVEYALLTTEHLSSPSNSVIYFLVEFLMQHLN